MSKLDVVKEKVGYLKLWLGIAVLTDISLFTWLLTKSGESVALTLFAMFAIVAVTGFTFFIHKRIDHYIRDLENL